MSFFYSSGSLGNIRTANSTIPKLIRRANNETEAINNKSMRKYLNNSYIIVFKLDFIVALLTVYYGNWLNKLNN
jgi:hypothetical protein